jgi:MFS transporter, PAT family, beta-lactamase induction signal transducer AmpG
MPTLSLRLWPALLFLGFASGLPNLLVADTLLAWLQQAGWNKEDLLRAGYVTLPYALKVVWAPLLDRVSIPLFGRRRGWMLVTQIIIMGGLVVMGLCDAHAHAGLLLCAAAMVAFASATQDLAVNAYSIDAVPPRFLTTAAGLSVWGYRVGMLIAGGVALLIAEKYGWHMMYFIMALSILPGIIGSFLAPEPITTTQPMTWTAAICEPLRDFRQRLGVRGVVILLLFVLLYRLSDGLAAMMTGPFLVAMQYSLSDIGWAKTWVGLGAAACGAGLAAWTSLRFGLLPSLWLWGIAQALSNFGYVAIDQAWWTGNSALIGVLFFDTVCAVAAATAFVGWLMGFCTPTLAATQYALLTAITVLGPHLLREPLAAYSKQLSWSMYFMLTVGAMIPGLIMLYIARHLPRRNDISETPGI